MHRLQSLALGAALLAAPSLAQAQPAPSAPPVNTIAADVQPGRYTVEPTHARLLFAVSHMGFSIWYGEFTRISGTLSLNPKAPSASTLDITIQANSVSTSNAKLNGELNGPTWFNTAKYPVITFKSTQIVRTGPGSANVTGNLTFHGVTRPEVLHVSFMGSGENRMSKQYTAGFNATAELKRSDFGVAAYVPLVGDDVTLMMSVPFVK